MSYTQRINVARELLDGVYASNGIRTGCSAPWPIQQHLHKNRHKYKSPRHGYSELGSIKWGRDARRRWTAKDILWRFLLEGLCRSKRLYTHKEIGDRILSRARAAGLTEEQIEGAGLKDLDSRAVRYRLRKYGLKSRRTSSFSRPKSDNFSIFPEEKKGNRSVRLPPLPRIRGRILFVLPPIRFPVLILTPRSGIRRVLIILFPLRRAFPAPTQGAAGTGGGASPTFPATEGMSS